MSDFFPQGGLSQAYTALTRFVGIERNTGNAKRGTDQPAFAAQIDQAGKQDAVAGGDTLTAQARTLAKDADFKEYFVASTTSFDPNAPRGSYVNIVV